MRAYRMIKRAAAQVHDSVSFDSPKGLLKQKMDSLLRPQNQPIKKTNKQALVSVIFQLESEAKSGAIMLNHNPLKEFCRPKLLFFSFFLFFYSIVNPCPTHPHLLHVKALASSSIRPAWLV